jgi:sulfate transport system ATP-binding protein
MEIRLENVSKQFEGFAALQPTTLAIPSGQLVALLGPSGSGKTTLLRLIAGLLPVDQGRIVFAGRDATRLSLRERQVGFVFQHYALFPHMSVFENVAFGLRSRPRKTRPAAPALRARVDELLALVQMAGFRDRLPGQLSGGQRQRVALARAMAIDPTVLLLDEPFGALDAKVRFELRSWLRRLHDETGFTTVFVTHDQEEALELADRVVVMNQGRIEQDDTPDRVYASPASAFVFDFLGRSNQIAGEGGRRPVHGAGLRRAGRRRRLRARAGNAVRAPARPAHRQRPSQGAGGQGRSRASPRRPHHLRRPARRPGALAAGGHRRHRTAAPARARRARSTALDHFRVFPARRLEQE